MKKTVVLLSLGLFSVLFLTACGKKSEELTENVQPTEIVDNSDCKSTVQKYLDWADKEWQWEEIKEWDNIIVDYIWRLEDWTVFDTSIKSIAEACNIYNEARDYTEWLSFEAMWWQMVKWFDEAVIWMKLWQTKTVKFWPEKWYWEYDDNLVITYSESEVWDLSQFIEWETIYLWMWYPAKIVKVTDKMLH